MNMRKGRVIFVVLGSLAIIVSALAGSAEGPQELACGVEGLDPAVLPVENIYRPVLKDIQSRDLDE